MAAPTAAVFIGAAAPVKATTPVFDPVKATTLFDATPDAPVALDGDLIEAPDEPGTPGRTDDVVGIAGTGVTVGLVEAEPEVTVTMTVTGEHEEQVRHAVPVILGEKGLPLVGAAIPEEVRGVGIDAPDFIR